MTELQRLIEEIDEVEDAPGDISSFQAPSKPEWEFVDEDHRYPGVLALDQAADMLSDGSTFVLADFFLKIGELMNTYNEAPDLEIQIINGVRELTQTLSQELMDGEEGMVMVPSSNAEIVSSLKYMFNRVVEALKAHA